MAHAMVDTAVNTDSWLMEAAHKEEADRRQQGAETEANVKHKHGIEIVAGLSKCKTCHTISVQQAIISKICCHGSWCFKRKCHNAVLNIATIMWYHVGINGSCSSSSQGESTFRWKLGVLGFYRYCSSSFWVFLSFIIMPTINIVS